MPEFERYFRNGWDTTEIQQGSRRSAVFREMVQASFGGYDDSYATAIAPILEKVFRAGVEVAQSNPEFNPDTDFVTNPLEMVDIPFGHRTAFRLIAKAAGVDADQGSPGTGVLIEQCILPRGGEGWVITNPPGWQDYPFDHEEIEALKDFGLLAAAPNLRRSVSITFKGVMLALNGEVPREESALPMWHMGRAETVPEGVRFIQRQISVGGGQRVWLEVWGIKGTETMEVRVSTHGDGFSTDKFPDPIHMSAAFRREDGKWVPHRIEDGRVPSLKNANAFLKACAKEVTHFALAHRDLFDLPSLEILQKLGAGGPIINAKTDTFEVRMFTREQVRGIYVEHAPPGKPSQHFYGHFFNGRWTPNVTFPSPGRKSDLPHQVERELKELAGRIYSAIDRIKMSAGLQTERDAFEFVGLHDTHPDARAFYEALQPPPFPVRRTDRRWHSHSRRAPYQGRKAAELSAEQKSRYGVETVGPLVDEINELYHKEDSLPLFESSFPSNPRKLANFLKLLDSARERAQARAKTP